MSYRILIALVLIAGCASSGGNGKSDDNEAPPTATGSAPSAAQPAGANTPLPSMAPLEVPPVPAVMGNGELVSVPVPSTAQVAVRILFFTGSVDDPPGREGLTALTARLIAEGGSQELSYPQLLRALYPMAAEIRAQVEKEATVFAVLVHKDHVPKLAPILAGVLTHPRLQDKDLTRIRQDMINDLEKRLRAVDDENLGKEALNSMLYPAGHPYHHSVLGTVEGLKAITLDEAKRHAQQMFGKKRMLIGLAGAVNDTIEQQIAGALQSIPDGASRKESIPAGPTVDANEVLIVKKPAKAVAISMGYPHSAFRGHPDYPALALVQSYFGEHRQFQGILMTEMREKRALNYGDYAYVENFIQDGWSRDVRNNIGRRRQHFEMWIRPVAREDTVFAVRIALFLREQLVRDGISQAKISDTAEFLQGYTRLWDLTAMRKLGWALDDDFYQFDRHLDQYRERLPKIVKSEVDQAIRRNLASPGVKIAIVAEDAEGLKAELLAGAPSSKKYEAAPPQGALELDAQFASYPLRLTPDHVRVVPVEEMFQK